MTEEEDRRRERNNSSSWKQSMPSGRRFSDTNNSKERRENVEENDNDPLRRIAGMVDDGNDDEEEEDEVANRDIIAQFIAMKLAAQDEQEQTRNGSGTTSSNPIIKNPQIKTVQRKAKAEETIRAPPRKDSTSSRQARNLPPVGTEKEPNTSDQDITKRIIAMRLAAIDDEVQGNESSADSKPEDPLERIMNMSSEDQLLKAMSLMAYTDSETESEEDDNTIIRSKDFRELNKMIQENNLQELERRAEMLANTIKSKLPTSNLADLRTGQDASFGSDTGLGYLARALGEHRDAVSCSHAMSRLDISKITTDGEEEGDRRFVSMSDSILETPTRNDRSQERVGGLLGSLHKDSMDSSKHNEVLAAPPVSRRLDDSNSPKLLPAANEWTEIMADPVFRIPPTSPRKHANQSKGQNHQEGDGHVADWWGVLGSFASFRSDFSDSQTSFTESFQDSSFLPPELATQVGTREISANTAVSSEPTPQRSDRNNATTTGKVVGTSRVSQIPKPSGLSVIDENQTKKEREVDAWKSSLAKSFLRKNG